LRGFKTVLGKKNANHPQREKGGSTLPSAKARLDVGEAIPREAAREKGKVVSPRDGEY